MKCNFFLINNLNQKLKMKFPHYISIFILSIFFISCSFKTSELEKGMWKYCGGYYIGDLFNSVQMQFRNDTIYINNIPNALIIAKNESFLGSGKKVIIKSIKSGEVGTYCGK